MKKKKSVLKLELLLILLFVACTRPASIHVKPEAGVTTFPTASIAVPLVSRLPESTELEIILPTRIPRDSPLPPATGVSQPYEIAVTRIPLNGPITDPQAEISGMAWHADDLLLLPQYPKRFGKNGDGAVFILHKPDILRYINGEMGEPLTPGMIPFITNNLETTLKGFEGFEAIAVEGEQVFLTIETKPDGMIGYIVSGQINLGMSQINLDTSRLTPITPQTRLINYSDEALLVFGSRLFTIYEINGTNLNPAPLAHQFDFSLQSLDSLAFPNIEYRITDATSPDEFGRFWAINYFFPGEIALKPASDPLADRFGEGPSHTHFETVERLVEFQFSYSGIILSESPPIQLEIIDDKHSRNWEAITRLDGYGFLLSSDRYPETILGYVPYP